MKKRSFLLIAIIFLTGCATASHLPSITVTYTPTTSVSPTTSSIPTTSLEILWNEPEKPYVELGKISVKSRGYSEETSTLFNRLKQKAMEIGADAVIIGSTQSYKTAPWGSWLFISGSTVYVIEGLAIKYKEKIE